MQAQKRTKAKLFDIKKLPLDAARLTIIPTLSLLYRIKKLKTENQKYKELVRGGAIIASNHITVSDALLVATTFWYRRMYYFVAEIVMSNKIKSFLMRHAGAIKVDRYSFDIEAINKSVDVLRQGHLLAIFPQGGVKHTQDVQEIKSGAVLMALRAEVPIIPMYIEKRKHWYKRTKVYIGDPMFPCDYVKGKFPTSSDIEKITSDLMDRMNKLAHYE